MSNNLHVSSKKAALKPAMSEHLDKLESHFLKK